MSEQFFDDQECKFAINKKSRGIVAAGFSFSIYL